MEIPTHFPALADSFSHHTVKTKIALNIVVELWYWMSEGFDNEFYNCLKWRWSPSQIDHNN